MFTPTYILTNKLFSNITTSERLYGQIEALKLPEKLELNLKRTNFIESTYASNRIEGNPLNHAEVTNLLLSERVPVNRDEKEITNYFDLLGKLPDLAQKPLTLDLILELHDQLFSKIHETAGEFRNEIVAVGRYVRENGKEKFRVKHLPPYHAQKEIKQALNDLIAWIATVPELPIILTTGIFHHHFVYIHPFEDGNGRVCRILTALLFLKAGYRINKYFILDDYYDLDRIQYSDMLSSADDGDKTAWLEYYSDGVKYSLQSALARAKNALQTLSMSERPTPKERQVMELMSKQPEMTSTEIAVILNVTRQQAHNLLSSLVEKGLLERLGTTKSSYYRVK